MLTELAKFGSRTHIRSIIMLPEHKVKYSESNSFLFGWSNNTRKPITIKNSVAYAIILLTSFKSVGAAASPKPCSTEFPLDAILKKLPKPLTMLPRLWDMLVRVAEEDV